MPETNSTTPQPTTPTAGASDGAGELDLAAQIDALLADVDSATTELAQAAGVTPTPAEEPDPAGIAPANVPADDIAATDQIDEAKALADEVAALASELSLNPKADANTDATVVAITDTTRIDDAIDTHEAADTVAVEGVPNVADATTIADATHVSQPAAVVEAEDTANANDARDDVHDMADMGDAADSEMLELPVLPAVNEITAAPAASNATAADEMASSAATLIDPAPLPSTDTDAPLDISAEVAELADSLPEAVAAPTPAHDAAPDAAAMAEKMATTDAADAASPASSVPGVPGATSSPDDSLNSEVNDLLASFADVLPTPAPEAVAPNSSDAASEPAPTPAASPSAPVDLDSEIAALTSTIIHREAPTASPVPEIEPIPAAKPAVSGDAHASAPKHADDDADLAASIAAIAEKDTPPAATHTPAPAKPASASPAHAAAAVASPAPSPKGVIAMLAPIGTMTLHGAGSIADVVAKPLASRPALARGIGWIAINTIFLAACLWAFLIFVRWPAVEHVKPSTYDFAHGALPEPKPPEAAHGGDAHADDGHGAAKDDGHGAKKDDGHGAKKPAKKEAKKPPAKKDPKKDAKKKDDGHH